MYSVSVPEGWHLVTDKPYTENAADAHLRVVLAYREYRHPTRLWVKEFVSWLFNAQTGGCENGHYFESLDAAANDYRARGIATDFVTYQTPAWR